jgi:hypothetical protein
MSADHPVVQTTAVGSFVVSALTGYLTLITGLVVLAYYLFLLIGLPEFKRFMRWLRSWFVKSPPTDPDYSTAV